MDCIGHSKWLVKRASELNKFFVETTAEARQPELETQATDQTCIISNLVTLGGTDHITKGTAKHRIIPKLR